MSVTSGLEPTFHILAPGKHTVPVFVFRFVGAAQSFYWKHHPKCVLAFVPGTNQFSARYNCTEDHHFNNVLDELKNPDCAHVLMRLE